MHVLLLKNVLVLRLWLHSRLLEVMLAIMRMHCKLNVVWLIQAGLSVNLEARLGLLEVWLDFRQVLNWYFVFPDIMRFILLAAKTSDRNDQSDDKHNDWNNDGNHECCLRDFRSALVPVKVKIVDS